jgi:hypothetical protein
MKSGIGKMAETQNWLRSALKATPGVPKIDGDALAQVHASVRGTSGRRRRI